MWARLKTKHVCVLGLSAIAALALNTTVVRAQNGRSYSVVPVWWEAGRGVIFPRAEEYDNPTGTVSILNTAGAIHPKAHAFFEALGTNGRACVTCHQPANAMSVSTVSLNERW